MAFRVGQKVVCIKGCSWREARLVKGNVYTIAAVGKFGNALHVDVAEAEAFSRISPPLQWDASRFRPIVERKTDISIFKAMLNPHGVDA
ncbi:hypothetical protein [Bradyrhizobium sp. SZCCHNRI1073]|uniref:hypothetical protein n=1 Tax=Bradyrhizobium sp. SZCCHNRI1073 TaxID=3057280 RepID=UPI0029163F09|nr:hypothetical protein [Bradyrhizobium sp. SZCCHNRI1073]